MTNHRIIVPETGEKFELLCGRSQLRRMVKLIEGKKIFSKDKTRIAKYHIPADAYRIIKENHNGWLHRDCITDTIWLTAGRPTYDAYGINFPLEFLKIVTFDCFIPENTIVACSDVLKYGECIYG